LRWHPEPCWHFVFCWEHGRAATAEGVIAAVLAFAGAAAWSSPRNKRPIARAALAFALLGSLVGAFTIAIGIGSQTPADLAVHAFLLLGPGLGLVMARQRRGEGPP
jgi:peptidoglycan/LPS O-acetylase OafA/YrhL